MTHRLAVVLALVLALPASATLVTAVEFDEKVDKANAIIVGRCLSKESRWDDSRRWILTYHRFAIEKSLKGFPAPEMTIVTPGGIVDNIQQDTIGVPRFNVGDEHVLFIRNTQAGPTVLFFDQGAYQLTRDERGERIVTPAATGAVLIDTQAGRAAAAEQPRTLREFEGLVRDTIRRREAMRMHVMERQRKEQGSLVRALERNLPLVLLALVGVALATWQLIKRW